MPYLAGMPPRPLFDRWPALSAALPFTPLGEFPTPVAPADELATQLGIATLSIKRDDISAADYGGNKVRKLEFLLGDVLAKHKTAVVTFGGQGSNHAIATAINCKKLGLRCGAVLTPEPMTAAVQAALARHAQLGTHIAQADTYADIRAQADQLAQTLGPAECYEIPFGGSSWVGALGFVNAGLELAEQIAQGHLSAPDVIYFTCGTTGSIAGLALGLALADLPIPIQAVQVTPDSLQPKALAERLYRETYAALAEHGITLADPEAGLALLTIRRDQLGDGYAEPTAACRHARERWEKATGLPMSLTYTAKAFAAVVADAQHGQLHNKHVLFWNTYNSVP